MSLGMENEVDHLDSILRVNKSNDSNDSRLSDDGSNNSFQSKRRFNARLSRNRQSSGREGRCQTKRNARSNIDDEESRGFHRLSELFTLRAICVYFLLP